MMMITHILSLSLSLPLSLSPTGVGDLAYGSGPHIVAVTSDGKLFSWGHNGYGQLGQGLAVTSGQYISSPQKIEGPLEGTAVVKVACGGHHTLALTKGGKACEMLAMAYFSVQVYTIVQPF